MGLFLLVETLSGIDLTYHNLRQKCIHNDMQYPLKK